jgi:biopolymer transport protein TolQ
VLALILSPAPGLLLQLSIWDLVRKSHPVPVAVLSLLLILSLVSWTFIFSKGNLFRQVRGANARFARAFRKASGFEAVALASEQFPVSPLVAVFDFGYEELERQVKQRGGFRNKLSVERSLQLGISEELTKLERSLSWLATVASVSPFIGLFGTVWGIIDAFQSLSMGSNSLRAVAPGIGEALVTTAMGLLAAIPAAMAYNYFGGVIREQNARMEDFSLEFMNFAERHFGE